MPKLAEVVKNDAESFKDMREAGIITDEEMEFLRLEGLGIEKRKGRRRRKTLKSQKPIREPDETQKPLRTFLLLSEPVKTKQDRLRF